MIDLSGKTALVTGGSRGIGRASCILLARAGANIVLGYQRDHEAAHSVVEECRLAGRHAIALAGDIARPDVVRELFDRSRETFAGVDVVVHNAGIWREAPIDQMTEQQWQETLDTNLKSAYLLSHVCIPEMKSRGTGNLIFISSTAGQRGEAFYSHYAASKGALIAFTKSLAAEVGPDNIRVNCVAPGWVETDMTSGVFGSDEVRESIRLSTPIRRIATAEDIAGVVLFLASDLARHVQGEVINVNGGSVLCG